MHTLTASSIASVIARVAVRIMVCTTLCTGTAYADQATTQPPAENWIKAEPDGCWVYFSPAPARGLQVTWSGACVDGKAQGTGKLIWQEPYAQFTDAYNGELQAGQKHGRGKHTSDWFVADGNWVWDDFTGEGEVKRRGCVTTGNFVDMLAFGPVHIRCKNGDAFEGNARYGALWGFASGELNADSELKLVGREKTVTPKGSGIGRLIGKGRGNKARYMVQGWWEYGALRHACNTAQQCEAWVKQDDLRQAKLVAAQRAKAQYHPSLKVSTQAEYAWYAPDGTLLTQGEADADGNTHLAPAQGYDSASDVQIYVLEVWSGRYVTAVRPECWQRLASEFAQCTQLVKVEPTQLQNELDAADRARDAREIQDAKDALTNYQAAAQASIEGTDAQWAWLPPLPPAWSDEEYQTQYHQWQQAVRADLALMTAQAPQSLAALQPFVCPDIGSFGAVPQQEAVDYYLRSLNRRSDDAPALDRQKAWEDLAKAANAGNWMARVQQYVALDRRDDDLAQRYRKLQIGQWLQANKVAAFYYYQTLLLASSLFLDGEIPQLEAPTLYAATHGSYSAMHAVGKELMDSTDATLAQTGEAMVRCARTQVPALFE